MKPNLLFIMTDHQRADSLYMKQDGIAVTPNLNKLASESSMFTRAYNTCPLCVPGRTALATGRYPTENGAVFNCWEKEIANHHKTVHQYFAEEGYTVGQVGVDQIKVKPQLKSQDFFDEWTDLSDYNDYCTAKEIPYVRNNAYKKKVVENQEGVNQTAYYSNAKTGIYPSEINSFKDIYFSHKSVDFIQKTTTPFALFVNLWAPHPPFLVPEPYASKFNPETIDLPDNVGVTGRNVPPKRRYGVPAQLANGVTMEEWQKAWAAHLGLVNLADYGIGLILDALKTAGHFDNTIIVFTSDHGDHLGQHQMFQKMEMFEQAVNVPLMIHHPEAKAQNVNSVVSHLDILPTLLDFIGINPVDKLSGRSLADTVLHNTPMKEQTVYCQYSGNSTIGDIRRAAITKRYKYIYTPEDLPELYDLQEDPLEMDNLAGSNKLKELESKLFTETKEWHEQHGDFINYVDC